MHSQQDQRAARNHCLITELPGKGSLSDAESIATEPAKFEGGTTVIAKQQEPKKPTYRDLWYDQGAILLDVWEGGTKLDENTLSVLWNHYPVSKEAAELALREYNELFRT